MFRIELKNIGQLNTIAITGYLLTLLAVVGLFLAPETLPAIIVTTILAFTYALLTWRTAEDVHLYPATIFLSAAYLLLVGQVGWFDAMLIWLLPFQIALFILGAHLRRRDLTAYAIPIEVGGHLPVMFLVSKYLLLSHTLWQPILVVFGLLLITVIDLLLARLFRERWYLFSACVFLALAYLFILRFAPGGAPEQLIVFYSLAAVAFGLLGWWVRKSWTAELAEPIEAAALLVGIAGGLSGLLDGSTVGLNALLIGAIAYTLLFLSTRGEEYIYLIFLSAGAIGFQFVRIAGERYTPELVDQFLVGLAVVGAVFFYPVVRRMIRGGGSLQDWLNQGGWARVLLIGLPVAILVPAIGVNYTFEATANPTFCGSCHIMETQYEAWNRNPHREVTCDTCHYPPGLEFFVQGKMVGISEVVNNVIGTFGTKPHGTVDTANCVSCHPIPELIDVSSPYRGAIAFNHAELKPGNEMGITMRCNNCHSHIVDGYHFQVRESTCYWCHFMDRTGPGTSVGDCFTCHETPVDDTHIDVVDSTDEYDCTTADCHVNVTVGEGEVRPERCLSCHGQIDPRVGEALPMHELHIVAETTFLSRKVECLECHNEITHGEEVFETETAETETTP